LQFFDRDLSSLITEQIVLYAVNVIDEKKMVK